MMRGVCIPLPAWSSNEMVRTSWERQLVDMTTTKPRYIKSVSGRCGQKYIKAIQVNSGATFVGISPGGFHGFVTKILNGGVSSKFILS